jgi:hypothetical protein
LYENEANAATEIDTTPSSIRGNNVILNQALPSEDPSAMYKTAFEGGFTLLQFAVDIATESLAFTGFGFLVSMNFMAQDVYEDAAKKQAAALLFKVNSTCACAYGLDPVTNALPVDSSLCVSAYWILKDNNNANHTLRVIAEVGYYEMNGYGQPVYYGIMWTSTQVKLTVDNNNNPNTAYPIQSYVNYSKLYLGFYDAKDFFKIYIPYAKKLYVNANADRSYNYIPDFEIHIWDPSGTETKSTTHGYDHHIEVIADKAGYWLIEARAVANGGFYSLYVGFATYMPTFYFRSDKATENSLFTERLLVNQTGVSGYKTRADIDPELLIRREYWGIRVYKRSSAGVETEVTNSYADPVALVYMSYSSQGIQSAVWQCPETQLALTDSLIIKVYTAMYDPEEGFYPWQLQGTWQTPRLGVTKLSAATWAVYYYTYWSRVKHTAYVSLTSRFYYDTATYNSRIEGITY